jgi:glycosyltransferase involved in cell wall biosynthesis
MPGRTTQVTRRIGLKLRSIAKLIRRPLPDTPRFHVFTPLTVPAYGTPVGRALNARLVRLQVALAARWVGLGRSPVVFVTIPTAWEVVRDLPRRSLVVNRSDKHSAFGEAPQSYIRSLEIDLIEHADAVCYVSRSLMDDERQHAGDRGMFLDHGVDLEHFRARAPSEQPRDLRALPRPRVGFFGGLEDYLVDFALLERVAAEIPEAQLVLIGDATSSLDTITRHPNAHWLGFKPYEQIPLYGSGFDVALMPWLDNHWIRHSNPIKLKEYLALGLAVVTTDFPEARHYADWIAIADDADAFISAVRDALSGGGVSTPSERRAAVAGASWDVRANELLRVAERRFSRLDTQRTT